MALPGNLTLRRDRDPWSALVQMGSLLGVRRGVAELPLPRLKSALREVDEPIGGGLPKGRISEIIGAPSSGKTSLAWRFLASTTLKGEMAAVVDCANSFDPAFARAAGVALERLLWVCPPTVRQGVRCTEEILVGGGFSLVILDLGLVPLQRVSAGTCVRLSRLAEKSRSVILLLAPGSLARSFSALTLRLQRLRTDWRAVAEGRAAPFARVLEGVLVEIVVVRNKLGPPGGKALVPLVACQASPPVRGGQERATVSRMAGGK